MFNKFSTGTRAFFPPHGKVFYPAPLNSYCSFQVVRSAGKIENGDDYIVKSDSLKPLKYYNLIRKPALSCQSLPLEELQKIGMDRQEGTYYIHIINTKELIGPFVKDHRGFLPRTGKEAKIYNVSSGLDNLLPDNDKPVFLNAPDVCFDVKSEIDCMSDEQLREWFRNKLKEIQGFSTEKENAIRIMKEMLKEKSLSSADDLDTVRFERVRENFDQYLFSYEELKDLFINDGFDKISQKIEAMRSEIKQEYESSLLGELEHLNEEKIKLGSEKDIVFSEINEMKSEKENIEKEIRLLTENRDLLMLQFRTSAQMGIHNANDTGRLDIKSTCYEIPKDGKSFAELKAIDDSYEGLELHYRIIEKNLNRAGYDEGLFSLYQGDESSLLKARAVFIPCISWAYIFAQSIGNAKVYAMHVEHDWLHYRDFCENGLLSIWNDASEEKDKNYILVLEDFNITQPECGCTPFLDVINGYRPILEGTDLGLPKNLKIFATVIPPNEENVGLRLSERLFRKWGRFGDFTDINFMYPMENKQFTPFGYFEAEDLTALYDNVIHQGGKYFGTP
ncbi:MAG: hypothetical protein LBR10_05260 [Prevotellaceae bacterium]|nr:hypothetical protein [Prevotellaceae bacterium]